MGALFKDLIVWQRAVELSVAIYGLTASFPSSEQFGLVNQMRRASVSIVSNIAEGYGRLTRGEYVQQLVVERLGFSAKQEYEESQELSGDVRRMLNALMRKLKT